ncbi:IS3 family transposase [Gallibacterium salpingitidis]
MAELESAIKDYVRYYNEEHIQLKLNTVDKVDKKE